MLLHKEYEVYLERKDKWEKTKNRIIGGNDRADSIEFYKDQLRDLKVLPLMRLLLSDREQ